MLKNVEAAGLCWRRRQEHPGAHISNQGPARMMRSLFRLALIVSAGCMPAVAQNHLSVHWEELTGPDFVTAIHQAQGVCVLPFGIIEKHGPHLRWELT
jgi:hypothetical protein